MSSALQNRLIGTVILVALVVIFLPDFLDGKKEVNDEAFVSVPATPPRKPIVDPEPFPESRVANASQRPIQIVDEKALDYNVKTPAEKARAELSDSAVKSDTDIADGKSGWVVQLGSFRHEKNVKQLLEKLKQAGYQGFSRPIQTNSGPLTKVFVGPDVSEKKLQSALPQLKEITGLKGKVTTFKVE